MVDQTVVNASPIILLSGQADWSSFGQWRGVVWIPNPVVTEVEAKGSTDPAAQALSAASWARRIGSARGSARNAGSACNPRRPRSAALCSRPLGIPVFGTIGVVLRGKRLGAIPAVPPVLERLATVGMHVRLEVVDAAAALVGE